jgi:hypothetical protein
MFSIFDCDTRQRVSDESYATADEAYRDYYMNDGHTFVGVIQQEATMRYVLEGTWRGYKSSQDAVVHREVVQGNRKSYLAWLQKTFCIRYTDGTTLELNVRPAKPRERVVEKHGYRSLIDDCFHQNVSAVADLK